MKQQKTPTNPKGAGRKPPAPNSKTLQIRSVPIHLHDEIRKYVKSLLPS